ncbi:hypothetical protein DFR27_2430 [Umboniibacter marinipuniceus]|uniref:Esterase n=2 Tax=Umboniibacter marinipuniceus TaxID=569599 RepID=A0A3L9ZXK2_9GAMM|nr:hypothetical protein DFR27_2430 [Umboniibacter marinipuniceus]
MACTFIAPAKAPIDTVVYSDPDESDTLIVMLPGAAQWVEEYEERGLVRLIEDCNAEISVIGAQAYFGYYRTKTIVTRLREDIILPAIADGKTNIWLLGTSMGGVGTLLYRAKYPAEISGIMAMAPYVGDEDELTEYLNAEADAGDNKMAIIWRDLERSAANHPSIVLGYGSEDGLGFGIRWLASMLPSQQVHQRSGGHDWETWMALWPDMLESAGLCTP